MNTITTSEDAAATDDRLRLLIERIENLNSEKQGIQDDIKDVYAEAKSVGYDTKIMKIVVRKRKQNRDDRHNEETMTEVYKAAVGLD